MSKESEWVFIKEFGNEWCNDTISIDPVHETAKITHYEITHWGYHDECSDREYDEPISIEKALQLVWPDEKAIARIIDNTKKDYSETLKRFGFTKS